MNSKSKGLLVFIAFFALNVFKVAPALADIALRVTTFNVQTYGYTGSGTPEKIKYMEERDRVLRDYIHRYLGTNDVIFFEEIMDPPRFVAKVIPQYMDCYTYGERPDSHMYVVTCVNKRYAIINAVDDGDLEIEQTEMGRLRPTFHGVLINEQGKKLAHLLGVHLKARPEFSHVRLEQTDIIADYIRHRAEQLPVILAGDFNSYDVSSTDPQKSDLEIMANIFKNWGTSVQPLFNPHANTFRNDRYQNQFDHFFVSHDVRQLAEIWVAPACNVDNKMAGNYDNIEFFNQYVSDHCPVTVDLMVTN